MTRTVKKFFLVSSLTLLMKRTSSRACCWSSVTDTVDRVARLLIESRNVNHFSLSTRLKPFIVRNVSIMSPLSLLSVNDVSPTLCSLSSYVSPFFSEISRISLRCTFSRISLSPSNHGDQAATACSRSVVQRSYTGARCS